MRTVNFILPKSWMELTPGQLLFVANLFVTDFAKTKFRFLTHALINFSGLRIKKEMKGAFILKKKGEKSFKLHTGQLHATAAHLDFLLKQVTEVKPLPKIRNARAVHYRLYKTKFAQFLTAENFYAAYKATGDVAHLNALVATLYLKPNQSFDDALVKKRSRYFRWVKIQKKYTAFLWYSGFRWYVAGECPNLFRKTGSGEEPKVKEHVLNMIRGLTEGDVTKNTAVLEVDTWEALHELDAKAKDAKSMKEHYDKMKK